jgi:N6-adenosine-specific RNA methylase IME4
MSLTSTTLASSLKSQLDEIDQKIRLEVFNGFYESRLKIEIGMWEKGKTISAFGENRGVNSPNWRELERETGRDHKSLKAWNDLYEKYRDYDRFLKEHAEPTAKAWTKRALAPARILPGPIETPPLPEGKYQTIVLDPPWDYSDEGEEGNVFGRGRPPYPTMSIDQIAAELPVETLAADNAHIYLWITNRSLPKGFGLIEKWGFRYVTMLTWVKPSIGMGNYFRGTTEHVLFGVRGSLPLLRQDVGTHFTADRGKEHSNKPDEFYDLIQTCSPEPRLDMFYGKKRNGWTPWGVKCARVEAPRH